MITCPECGRANKESSKFCMQCGRALMASARPAGAVPRWGNDAVPDWLLDVQGHLPEELRDPELEQMARLRYTAGAAEPVPPAAESTAREADWLNSLRDQARAPESGVPSGEPAASGGDADAWLQGILSATQSAEAGPEDLAEGDEKLPDWLSDLRGGMYGKTQPVKTVPKAAETEAPEDRPADADVPDWLRSESYQKDVGTATQPQEMVLRARETPAPPVASTPAAKTAESPAGQDDLPDWLKNIDTGVPPAPTAPASGLGQEESAEVEPPDWLKHFEDVTPQPRPPAPAVSGAVPAEKSEVEPPEWLRDIAGAVEASQPPLGEPEQPSRLNAGSGSAVAGAWSESEMPEWLKSLKEPGAGASEAESPPLRSSEPSPGSGEAAPETPAPDWLRDTRQPESGSRAGKEPFEAAPEVSQGPRPDWLNRPPESADQPSPETEGSQTPVPDWLRGSDQAAAAALAKSPVPSEEEVPASEEPAAAERVDQLPDWLRSFRQEPPTVTGELTAPESPSTETLSEETPPETQIPDWVLKSGDAAASPEPGPTTEEAPVANTPVPEPEMPSWLADVTGPADEPPLPPAEESAPEWPETAAPAASSGPVKPAAPIQSPEPEVEPPAAAPGTGPLGANAAADVEMPEWLRNMRAQVPFNEAMEPPAWVTSPEAELPHEELPHEELPPIEEQTPGWLAGTSAPSGSATAADDMPEWLRELDQTTPVTPGGGVTVARPEIESESGSEEGQVPDWLKQMGAIDTQAGQPLESTPQLPEPSEPAPPKPTGPQPSAELRPSAPSFERVPSTVPPARPPAAPAKKQAPSPSPVRRMTMAEMLSGVSGALPVEQAIAAVRPGNSTSSQAAEGGAQGPEAGAFEDIVNQPLLAPSQVAAKPRRQFVPWLAQVVLSLLIIGAVVVPLSWQGDRSFFSEYNIPISARTVQFYDQINALQAGSPVWVVLDYDPSLAGELNTQARVLLGHLMQRRTHLFVISTTPTGPEIAQRLLDTLAAQPDNGYVYGKDYLNLGYLPGQEASLSLFAHDPLAAVRVDFKTGAALETFPILADLKQAPVELLGQGFPLMILLSGSQDGLRAWIEQVGAPTGVKLMAGVTAGIEPYAQTYVASRQLAGLLSGTPDAAQYEAEAQMPGLAVRSLDSQAGVHLLLVALIVLSNLVFGVRWLFSRRR